MKKPQIIHKLEMNFIRGVFWPVFESKLEFKKADIVRFKANKVKDELDMSGWGQKPGSIIFEEAICHTMKVSDYPKYESMIMREISRNIKDSEFNSWDVCYLTFNKNTGIISTEVWYKTKDGNKRYKPFESKF